MGLPDISKHSNGRFNNFFQLLHFIRLRNAGFKNAQCMPGIYLPNTYTYSVVDASTLRELRAAAAARREAEGRIEAAALAAHRAGLSWGAIGAQLGMTRQGARQRFERLVEH